MNETQNNLTISQLSVENVKGVKSISFSPSMATRIGGDNHQGKSSLIDAIILTLKNREMGSAVERVIHDGENSAETEIVFSNGMTVRSRWWTTEKGTVSRELKLTDKDGKTFNRPQDVLDGLISGFGFDPVKFYTMSREKQFETILGLTQLDVEKLNLEREELLLARRDNDRELDRLQKVLTEYNFSAPVERTSSEDVSNELLLAQANNLEIENSDKRIKAIQDSIETEKTSIKNTENQIALLKAQIAELESSIKASNAKIADSETDISVIKKSLGGKIKLDTEVIKQKLNEISEHNIKADAYAKSVEIKKEIDSLTVKSENFSAKINAIRTTIMEAINKLNLIDGLQVDIEKKIVTVKNTPVKDLSTSEQLFLATKLAMKASPEVKVLLIQNASLFDKKTLREVINHCNSEGWQVILETVGVGEIIIKEGCVLDPVERQKYIAEYLKEEGRL